MRSTARKILWILEGAGICLVLLIAFGAYWIYHSSSTSTPTTSAAPSGAVAQRKDNQSNGPQTIDTSSSPNPDSQQGFTLPKGVALFGDLKSGMTFYDFSAWYTKKAGGPPMCANQEGDPNVRAYTCTAVTNMDGIKVVIEYHFGDDELWEVAGNFSPEDFGRVKADFVSAYGRPESDVSCDDPAHRDKLGPKEMEEIRTSLGCEGLVWKATNRTIMLSQVPNGAGQRFSIMALPDKLY